MRASDFIGCDVLDASGRKVGVVTDLRCVQDGPLRGDVASMRVDAAVISARHTGSLLGYDRSEEQGPWLVRVVVRRLHRHMRVIPWRDLAVEDAGLRLRR